MTVKSGDGSPVKNAAVTVSIAMTSMDMGTAHPKVTNNGDGTYSTIANFSMSGPWRATVRVVIPGQGPITKNFDFDTQQSGHGMHMHGMEMGAMKGRLGDWGMEREASGTSWIPDSSPMYMKMLPSQGGFDLALMGFINFDENRSGGRRGDSRFFSNSMVMLMGRRQAAEGVWGVNLMASLDPVFNGEFGYPDLFQTGETAHGQKLTDYQHPHDLIDEVTVSYSRPIGRGIGAFVYGGPVGEPALGGPTFMHRPSGLEIPEAPITHHWFDSTHISFGVVTAGINGEKWQLEGSAFNGREPDENRYDIDPIRLDSASGRLTFNPTPNLSLNTSYGFLKSPESSTPGIDEHRFTAALIWNMPFGAERQSAEASQGHEMEHSESTGTLRNLAFTAAFGRKMVQGTNSDGFLAEATYAAGPNSIFGRWEHVEKDELVGVPAGNYMINKFLVGGVHDLAQKDGFDVGLGAYAGFYIFPSSLEPFYGRSPVTLGVFLRIRPGRM